MSVLSLFSFVCFLFYFSVLDILIGCYFSVLDIEIGCYLLFLIESILIIKVNEHMFVILGGGLYFFAYIYIYLLSDQNRTHPVTATLH